MIHSLNIAVAERWLLLLDENNNSHDDNSATSASTTTKYCNGVVLVPMETDEAPQRLQHIVHDSNPHLILVAGNESGDDWALGWRMLLIRCTNSIERERIRHFVHLANEVATLN